MSRNDEYKDISSDFWRAGMLCDLLGSDKKDSKHSKYVTEDKKNVVQPHERNNKN